MCVNNLLYVKKKRFLLPLVALSGLCVIDEVRTFVYTPLIITFSFFILFWNFPSLVYYTASRPLYYEDIFIDEKKLPNYEVNEVVKHKFQMILLWILIFTNSILTGVLSDYWLYKTDKIGTWFEILGVTGGIIKLFQIINNSICRYMLKILQGFIRKENEEKNKKEQQDIKSVIELKALTGSRKTTI
jgi:hypothetical protein|tara:strand:+ start:2137 stop:2697 length:561 start_codon:yes stop_codon:yes gene_type:complete